MKNSLLDLHNILMATMEDLDDPDNFSDEEKGKRLMAVAKAKSEVAKQIVELNKLELDAIKYANSDPRVNLLPESLRIDCKEK